jgi:hypothetical protein
MLKIKCIAVIVLVALLAVPQMGWTQQDEPDPHFPDTPAAGDVAGSQLTAISVQRITAGQAAQMIAMRFNPLFNPQTFPARGTKTAAALPEGFTSLSSGAQAKGVSLWANAARNKIENNFAPTAYDGHSSNLAVGGDYRITPWIVAGVSLNFANTDIDTPFNAGNSKTKGFTLMPYANFTLNDWLSADVSVGHAWNDTDNRRVQAGTTITGSQDSKGWLAVGNLNAQKWYDMLFVAAKAGLLYNQDKRSTFTESNGTVNLGTTNSTTQANVGGSVGYWLEPFMPSLSLTYAYDLDREAQVVAGGGPQPANDRDGLTVGLGVSFYGSGATAGLSVALAATSELLRENMTNKGLSLNARYAF